MLRVGPPPRQAVNDTRKPTGNIQCRCLSIQNRTIPPIPSSPRRGRPCPPEDLASFLYRIVMPSHPSATNARLAALRNGSRNADKIQTIPERNDDPDPKSDVSSAHPSRIPDESPEWFFAYPPSETAAVTTAEILTSGKGGRRIRLLPFAISSLRFHTFSILDTKNGIPVFLRRGLRHRAPSARTGTDFRSYRRPILHSVPYPVSRDVFRRGQT